MDNQDIVLTVITASLVLGVGISPAVDISQSMENLRNDFQTILGDQDQESEQGVEPTHRHAMFFLNLNGEEKNLTGEKYQLRSNYVHLENNRPHTVHKHVEGITWKYFLEKLDIDVNQSEDELCVTFSGDETCGNGSVVLNGEEITELEKPILQDDNFAIILPENQILRNEYMNQTLHRDYRPDTGTQI